MAATLLGEEANLSPVPDSQSYQDTGRACRCQQVFNDPSYKAEVIGDLVYFNQVTQVNAAVDSYSSQQDHEQFHDVLLLMIELTRALI